MILSLALVLLLAVGGSVALAVEELPPGGTFFDDDGTTQEGFIEAIRAAGITFGCNPPLNDLYCPERALTRAEMASLLVRALDLAPAMSNPFVDTADSVHVDTISALAASGITRGCNPPDNDMFCPKSLVTRAQMAAFLVRAFGYEDGVETDHFADDDDSVFEADINRIAAAGISAGCGDGDFCPARKLLRSEMAVFVARALGLTPNVPPERPPPPYPDVGSGKRIIYANDEQRVWMVDERGELLDTYLVSGRENVPAPGTYAIFSKSVSAWAGHDGITMKWMARFTKARSGLAIGFHGIPVWSNGQPMQTEDELGYFRSGGCVRQSDEKARALFEWAPIGTTVIVLP
jgi:hypothetical protein